MLEAKLGRPDAPFRFPPGRASGVTAMKLNLDPPASNTLPRPLFYYAVTDLLVCGVITPLLMRAQGFRHHRMRGVSYWFHPGETSPSSAASSSTSSKPAAAAASTLAA